MKKHKIVFFGTPLFSAKILAGLVGLSKKTNLFEITHVVTQPDTQSGRGKKIQFSPVKEMALSFGIRVLQPNKLKNNLEFVAEIPDDCSIAIVVAYGQILPSNLLNLPKFGCLNIHASLLPRWRGAAPIQRAIMTGDNKTGICLMKMDNGLDTGPVYSRAETLIEENDNFASLHDKLLSLSIDLLNRDLEPILAGKLSPIPQAEDGISYAKKIENSECLIDWNSPADNIVNQIRGLSPAPGAFTFIASRRLKIIRATNSLAACNSEKVGQIKQSKNSLMLASQDFWVNILEVQPEGKKTMSINVFLNGLRDNLDGKFVCANQ